MSHRRFALAASIVGTCLVVLGLAPHGRSQGKPKVNFVSAAELTKAFEVDLNAASKKYGGLSPVVVEGTALEVKKQASGNVYVFLKGHSDKWKVLCDFDKKDAKQVLDTVKAGKKVAAAGAGYGSQVPNEVLIGFCKLLPGGSLPPMPPTGKAPPTPPKTGKPEPAVKKAPVYKAVTGLVKYTAEPKWQVVELAPGLEYLTNRGYAVTKMPKEMHGAHVLIHDNTQGGWLRPGQVKVEKDAYLYVAIWTKAYGETRVSGAQLGQFEDDGWTLLEEPFVTSFPAGEGWEWRALRKPVEAGQDNFPLPKGLEGLNTQWIFAFKERKK